MVASPLFLNVFNGFVCEQGIVNLVEYCYKYVSEDAGAGRGFDV